ncbi:hypothetical protein, partial [Corynebacterium pseudodiphtheriticum]|uniref:hypothetical protein n=1 Tax=Corynebacterium pseudodiphtheriticum TaxID=37637 RepID=UPI002541B444
FATESIMVYLLHVRETPHTQTIRHSLLLKAAANSPLARIPAVRFLPGIVFICIGVFYIFELV